VLIITSDIQGKKNKVAGLLRDYVSRNDSGRKKGFFMEKKMKKIAVQARHPSEGGEFVTLGHLDENAKHGAGICHAFWRCATECAGGMGCNYPGDSCLFRSRNEQPQ